MSGAQFRPISVLISLVCFLAAVVQVASAGPNAGGTLIVHATPHVFCTDCTGCDSPTLLSCEDADTDAGVIETVWISIYAAFPAASDPRLGSVSFGIEYGNVFLWEFVPCGGSELPTADWPDSGAGTTVTFSLPRTGTLERVYSVVAYDYYGDLTSLALTPHPVLGGLFGDGETPETFDPIVSYGRFGFSVEGETPCPDEVPTGGCCDEAGLCVVTWEAECDWFGRAYLGDGTSCDGDGCTFEAACCGPTGSCEIVPATLCIANGGRFESEYDSCEPDPCVEMTGACCQEDGRNCVITTESECALYGVFFAAQFCNPSPCLGSCCLAAGGCIEIQPYLCDGNDSPIGTTCDPDPCPEILGACCFGNSSCSLTTPELCEQADGLFFEGIECDASLCLGACCLPDETCSWTRPNFCREEDGHYLGLATSCSPYPCPAEIGSCCLGDQVCIILGQEECALSGGTYLGGDESCEFDTCYGACCTEDGSCFLIRRDFCEDNGGVFFGSGSNCETTSCDPAGVDDSGSPVTLELGMPHPNPSSGQFSISFGLPTESEVRVVLYDVRGAEIDVLVEGSLRAGRHVVTWSAGSDFGVDEPSGVYFVRMTAGGEVRTRRVVISR